VSLRVGFILCGDLSTLTGGFLYDRMLIRCLEEMSVEVELIQLPWRSYYVSLMQTNSNLILDQLSSHQFDLIIQDELAHPSLVRVNHHVRDHLGLPLIGLIHHLRCSEDHPKLINMLYRYVEQLYLNTLDGVIVNSPSTLNAVYSIINGNLPTVIATPGRGHFPSQITVDQIRARSHQAGPLEVLFLGSIIPRKRLKDVVEAIANLQQIDIRLTVIGRENGAHRYVREVKQLIRSRDLEGVVRWLGPQPDSLVTKILAESHLLVVPSSHEGFGIAYLDAMSYGIVPIGSTSGGASSIINHAENGYLINPGDLHSLSRHIKRLASDRDLLRRMAIKAFRRYQQQPIWEEVSETVYDYLITNFGKDGTNA
jgi:glycosyltransferase involved in cell wall biosynthesis